jgi:hypothetical protein
MYLEKSSFYIERLFDDQLSVLSYRLEADIMRQITSCIESLPKKDFNTQVIGGVSFSEEKPTYFFIEYEKEDFYETTLINLTITDCDTYLDLINLKKTIKYERKRETERRA